MVNPNVQNPNTATLTSVSGMYGGTSKLRYQGMMLRHETDEHKDDKNVVLAYVRMNGDAFQYASPRLRDDGDILSVAMKNTSSCLFDFASPRLCAEKKDVLEAVYEFQLVAEVLQHYQNLPLYLKFDRDIVLAVTMKSRGEVVGILPLQFRADEEVILLALDHSVDASLLQYACSYLLQDQYVVVSAIAKFPYLLSVEACPFHRYRNDKSIIMQVVERNHKVLDHLPNFHDDEEVLRAAVSNRDYLIELEPYRRLLRVDKDLVLKALRFRRLKLPDLEPHFQQDRDVIMAAINTERVWTFPLDLGAFNDDDDAVMAAVSRCGLSLQYASDRLKDNHRVVLAAVTKEEHRCGCILGFASTRLRNDFSVVLAAVKNKESHGESLQYASSELQNNKELVLAAVNAHSRAFEFASEDLKDDPDVVLAALSVNRSCFSNAMEHASARIKSNRDVVLKALSIDGNSLQYVSDDLKADRDVVLVAVTHYGCALRFASEELRVDQRLVLAAVSSSPGYLGEWSGIGLAQRRSMALLVAAGQRSPSAMFRYGVCPVEWGHGEMSLSEYIPTLLRRIDARGQGHEWLKKKFDRSSSPSAISVDVNPQVHEYTHKILLVREISSKFKLSEDTTKRIVDYTSLEIDLQNYQELARCQDLINLIIVHDYSEEEEEDEFVIDYAVDHDDENNRCILLDHILRKAYSEVQQ